MSTKTTFKRIALVAVAALGFGVLSVVPSQAVVSGLVVTTTNGKATHLNSDSSTAATINVQFLALSGVNDSVTVDIVAAAAFPTDATSVLANSGLWLTESTTSLGINDHPTVDTAAAGAVVNGNFARKAGITVDTADDARSIFLTAPCPTPINSVIKANKGYDAAHALDPDGLLRLPSQGTHASRVMLPVLYVPTGHALHANWAVS
jgi:hypothetical protein